MQKALTLYQTSIGKKAVMAASGVILLGFTLGHLSGNLKAYQGPQALNEYAAWLRSMPSLLWGTRAALVFAFGAHVFSAFQLWSQNRGARPVGYRRKKSLATDYAARTMYWSGPILLLYVLFHLAHLTFGQTFGFYEFDKMNPYNNMVYGFQIPAVLVPYLLGNIALGVHLFHGIWSMFQSIGINHPKYNIFRRDLAIGLATLLTLGNLSFPIAVMLGYLEPTTQTFYFPELE